MLTMNGAIDRTALDDDEVPRPKVPSWVTGVTPRSRLTSRYTPGMLPSGPGEDASEVFTVGGRARLDNYSTAQQNADRARNAPAPGSNLSMGQRLARTMFPGMRTTAPGSMSMTLAKGMTPGPDVLPSEISTDKDGNTVVTRQGTQRPSDGIDAAQQARDKYIQDHDQLATALKPSWLINKEQGIAQNGRTGAMQDAATQMIHKQIDRYHQETPAVINRLTNSSDWTPEDRKQLLDTVRTYHEFNTALMRQMSEGRRQEEGDRRLDQGDSRVDQGQQRIDNQSNQSAVTSGQRDRGLSQRDRSLDQSDQRIQSQKSRPANRTGFGALIDLLKGGKGATTQPIPNGPTTQPSSTTQPNPYSPPLDLPSYGAGPGYRPGAFRARGQNAGAPNSSNTYPGMGEAKWLHDQLTPAMTAHDRNEPRPGSFTTSGRNLLTQQSGPIQVRTRAEAMQLAPGTEFIDPNGVKRVR